MEEKDIQEMFVNVLDAIADKDEDRILDWIDDEPNVKHVSTYEEVMMMTRDTGIVITMSDNSEFQITIKQSKFGEDNEQN